MKKTLTLLVFIVFICLLPFQVYCYNEDLLDDRIEPGGYYSEEGTNNIVKNDQVKAFVFRYDSSSESIKYLISWKSLNIKEGILEVKVKYNNETRIYPICYGGLDFRYKYKEEDEYLGLPLFNIKTYRKFDESRVWTPNEFRNNCETELYPYGSDTNPQTIFVHEGFNYKYSDGKIDEVWVRYKERYTENGVTTHLIKEYRFSIKGKTLIIDMSGGRNKEEYPDPGDWYLADRNYSGTNFGRSFMTKNVRSKTIPYTELTPVVIVDNKYFYSIYNELNLSEGSQLKIKKKRHKYLYYTNFMGISIPVGFIEDPNSLMCFNFSKYIPNTAEEINPNARLYGKLGISERIYLTVSNDIMDCLPVIENDPTTPGPDPSPYLDVFKYKSIYRIKGAGAHRYGTWEITLKRLQNLGIKDLIVVAHSWMKHGWCAGQPDFYPAPNVPGISLQEFDDFCDITLNELGFDLGVHTRFNTIYIDEIDKDNRYWNTDWEQYINTQPPPELDIPVCTQRDWRWQRGVAAIAVDSFGIPSDLSIFYAEEQSNLLKINYHLNTSYNDFTPGNLPGSDITLSGCVRLDYNETNDTSTNFIEVFRNGKELFQIQQEIFQGPMSGEGKQIHGGDSTDANCFQSFYAGYVDSTFTTHRPSYYLYKSPFVPPTVRYFVIPDFEVQRVTPMQINEGAGYYRRFFKIKNLEHVNSKDCKWKYFYAMTLAHNNCGFLVSNLNYHLNLQNYYLIKEIQKQYLNSESVEIRYIDGGVDKTLSQMLLEDKDFEKVVLKYEYSNGLKLWINFKNSRYAIEIDNKHYEIPQFGWLAYCNKNDYNWDEDFIEYLGRESSEEFDYYFVRSKDYIYLETENENIKTENDFITSTGNPVVYFGSNLNDINNGVTLLLNKRQISHTKSNVDTAKVERYIKTSPLPDFKMNNNVVSIYPQEYSEGILNNAWDMNDSVDISVQGFSSSQFLNGIWTGIMNPDQHGIISINIDQDKKINLERYFQFSFRLYTETGGAGKLIIKNENNISYESQNFNIVSGWNVYKFDLRQLSLTNETEKISVEVPIIEIKIDINGGSEIQLDLVQLKSADDYFFQQFNSPCDFNNKYDLLTSTHLSRTYLSTTSLSIESCAPDFQSYEFKDNRFYGYDCEGKNNIYLNVRDSDFWDVGAKWNNMNFQVDTQRYYQINIRMHSDTKDPGKIFFRKVGWNKIDNTDIDTPTWEIVIKPENSIPFDILEGWNIYTIDLSEFSDLNKSSEWLNSKPQILGLGFPDGSNIILDWISLECPDEYADAALQTFWDMKEPDKIAKYYFKNAIGFSDDGITEKGYLKLKTDLEEAELVLNISDEYKVDSEKYSVLKFRMYSDNNTSGKVTWETESGGLGQINIDDIYSDSHTYIIDLKESPDYKDKITTMSFFPSAMLGNEIAIDYIRLLSPDGAVGYTNEYKDYQTVVWGRDPGIRVDIGGSYERYPGSFYPVCAAVAPSIIELPDGSYRLYYDTGGCPYGWWRRVASAASTDGINWTKEGVVKFIGSRPYGPDWMNPCVIQLDDGRYRLFFDVWKKVSGIYYEWIISAISSDGKNFTLEPGVRINYGGPNDLHGAFMPSVIKMQDGTWKMYYSGRNYPGKWNILSASSADGYIFTKDEGIRIPDDWGFGNGVMSPDAVINEEGEITLVYSTYITGTNQLKIFYIAKSYDGLNFFKVEEINLQGGTDIYESFLAYYGCLFPFDDSMKLYYTGRKDFGTQREMRILSATRTRFKQIFNQSLNQVVVNEIQQINNPLISTYSTNLVGASTYYPVDIELTELEDRSLLKLKDGEIYSGEVDVLCEAKEEDGIVRVEMYVNNLKKSEKADYKLNYKWNTKDFENGDYILKAIAFDKGNNYGVETKVVKVFNQPGSSGGGDDDDDGDGSGDETNTLPVAEIISPLNNSVFNKGIKITGNAYDAEDFKMYRIYLNNITNSTGYILKKESTESVQDGELYNIDISEFTPGNEYGIKLVVYDMKGQVSQDVVLLKYFSSSDIEILELTGFNKPADVAVDTKGNIYVADMNASPTAGHDIIKIFDKDLNFISEVPAPQKPNSLFIEEIDNDIFVYVTEHQSNTLRKIKLANDEVLKIEGFLHPKGVWVTEEYIYIADTLGNKLKIFDREGIFVKDIEVNKPEGICVDEDGYIYTTNGITKSVNKFDFVEGSLLHSFGTFIAPSDVFIDAFERLWVLDRNEDIIKVYDKYGNELFELEGYGLNKPEGIFVDIDESGNTDIYIADRNNNRVLILKINIIGDEEEPEVPDDSTTVIDSNTNEVINYPNPCKNCDEVKIKFELPESGVVTLKIFNLNGTEVYSDKKNFRKGKREISWKLLNKAKKNVSSGIYLYILKVNGKEIGKGKIVIVK